MTNQAVVFKKKQSPLTQQEVIEYVKAHGTLMPNDQVKLTQPLKVYKRLFYKNNTNYTNRGYAIANLVIPIGAIVNLPQHYDMKMRASQAYCHSIIAQDTKRDIKEGFSSHNANFKYVSGKGLGLRDINFNNLVENAEEYGFRSPALLKRCKLVPASSFDTTTLTCRSGIHFFVEIESAKNYSL